MSSTFGILLATIYICLKTYGGAQRLIHYVAFLKDLVHDTVKTQLKFVRYILFHFYLFVFYLYFIFILLLFIFIVIYFFIFIFILCKKQKYGESISQEQLIEMGQAETNCTICQEKLVKPILLPCNHLFCDEYVSFSSALYLRPFS
jgi:hypothetical protein